MKNFKTQRYDITVEECADGGPAGYEATYLTSEGEPASEELYSLLQSYQRNCLPITTRNIRQRNGQALIKAIKENKTLGVVSGFKPSGAYHFGHKLTSTAVASFQKDRAQVFIPVADIECELDSKLSQQDYMYWAADNILDWGANGVNLDAAHVYLQSEEKRVNQLAYVVARSLDFDFTLDTYGIEKLATDFPFLFAGLTQVGDIILPQHPDFGDYHSFMLSGQDQDGHMKMTEQLVRRSMRENRVIPGLQTIPSGFYIPHIRGLTGKKASSSRQDGTIYLSSGPNPTHPLSLERRINLAQDAIDRLQASEKNRSDLKRGALDLVRYIDVFNQHSIVNFGNLLDEIPTSLLLQLQEEQDGKKKSELIDQYLIKQCEGANQDNVLLVRDTIGEALKQHQEKRKQVYTFALMRANSGSVQHKDQQPAFWNVPSQSIVDPALRNQTKWYHLIDKIKDRIIP